MQNHKVIPCLFRERGGVGMLSFQIFATIGLMVIVNAGCVTDANKARNVNQVNIEVAEVPSGGFIILSDPYESTDQLVEKDLEGLSRALGLSVFPRTPEHDRFELRLWTNLGGLGDARLLAVRADGNEFRAEFIAFGYRDGEMRVEKRQLSEPRSGWHRIAFPLTSKLTTPMGLRRDPHFELQRDEPLILLEVIQRGEYRRIFYGQSTKSPDGVKLKEVCEYLASEFEVKLDCNWTEPRYF